MIKRAIKLGSLVAVTFAFGTSIGCTAAQQESDSSSGATKPVIQPLDLQQGVSEIRDLNSYRDDKFPFTLMYPKDWEHVAVTHPGMRLSLINRKPDGSLNAGFNIVVEYSAELKDLSPARQADYINRYQNSSVEALKAAAGVNFNVVQRGEVKLGGQAGYYLVIEGDRKDDGVKPLRLLQMTTLRDGTLTVSHSRVKPITIIPCYRSSSC